MANDFMGMFTTPQEVRQKQLEAERAAYDKAMLSGDAFMQGQAMGRRIGGSVGGMMGITSAEEAKAQNIKNLFDETVAMSDGEFNLDTPENLTYFAKKLNDLGYSKEAMQMLEAAQKRREEGLQKRLTEAKVKVAEEGQFKPVVIGSTTNAMGDTITVRKLYNEVTGEFRNLDGTPYSPNQPTGQGGNGSVDKAAIAKNVEEYLKGLEKQRIQGENETNPFAIQDQ